MAMTRSPGLIEGLCKLKRDAEPFLRVSATCALRLLSRCNEACSSNRRLLRSKWHNVLKDDLEPSKRERAWENESEKLMQGSHASSVMHAGSTTYSHDPPGACAIARASHNLPIPKEHIADINMCP